jgi:protein tyrosine/serine phosphatase
MAAKPDYIQTAIDSMIGSYGSLAAYLSDGIGLNADKLERLNRLLLA